MNHIIASIANESTGIYGKLINSSILIKKKSLEEIVVEKFEPYYNKTIDEIVTILDVPINVKAKSFCADLTKAIFGISLKKEIEEFEKAEIITKSVRLDAHNLPLENISFPSFEYQTLYDESWRTSEWKQTIERKFLIVFFQIYENQLFLRKIKFWNMPQNDIKEARKVWLQTKKLIIKGTIVKALKQQKNGKIIRQTNFPKQTENKVSHVRPHATNSFDTYPLPVRDNVTQENNYTKHCFWLNNTYVRDEIYL